MRLFISIFILTLGLLSGCAQPTDPNLQSPQVQNSNSSDCTVWGTICNDIYQPVTCSANGLTATGANSCDGENRVRMVACEKGMPAAQIQSLSISCHP